MKYKTIREGEQAVIFNYLGEGRLVVGPSRVFLWRERLQKLKRYTASQYQYVILKDKDGIVTHKRGPCEVYFNPLIYDEISVQDAVKIDANHVVVVYKRMKDSSVQRRIIQGPTVFVPEAEEWIHEFRWHGTDPENKTRMVPGLSKFEQLAVIPDQFYYNVRDVRSTDDTIITVKLMLFYELKDILQMLDTTHDPIADMINAVCADVIAFIGKLTFQSFLSQTHKLSELETYPQLKQRAERVGYEIQKVVFRGYHSSEQLQAMQNNAIESRTQLRLNAEIEEQKQRLADFKLSKEQERTKMRQEMEKSKQDHAQKMEQLKQKHNLEIQQLQHEQKLQIQSMKSKSALEQKAAEDLQDIEHLDKLKEMGIELTGYLTCQQPPPVSEEIQVLSPGRKFNSDL